MLTLGIETSCDETACAVLQNSKTLLSNIIYSSLAKHRPFGGIVPEVASRHTLEHINVVYEEALREANINANDLDLICVTYGPGLIGSLFVGVAFAKGLSYALRIPLVGVNHLHAHVYSNFLDRRIPQDPFMGLVVSGGHTSVVYCNKGRFKELAATRDDACGEAFDKVAKILNLGFPGGPVIEEQAKHGNPEYVQFRCGRFKNSYDFSFSGIKTAVLYYAQKLSKRDLKKTIPHICASFQKSVVEDIVQKTIALAIKKRVRYVAVGGGVSANQYLRERLCAEGVKEKITVLFPSRLNSLDNGAMVARYGYELFKQKKFSDLRLSAAAGLGF